MIDIVSQNAGGNGRGVDKLNQVIASFPLFGMFGV